jgi:hypothetical protein
MRTQLVSYSGNELRPRFAFVSSRVGLTPIRCDGSAPRPLADAFRAAAARRLLWGLEGRKRARPGSLPGVVGPEQGPVIREEPAATVCVREQLAPAVLVSGGPRRPVRNAHRGRRGVRDGRAPGLGSLAHLVSDRQARPDARERRAGVRPQRHGRRGARQEKEHAARDDGCCITAKDQKNCFHSTPLFLFRCFRIRA